MKNKHKKPNIGIIINKKQIRISLVIILLGVFLLPKTAYLSTINDEKIIELTNIERNERGLSSLNANQLLTKAAYNKANALMKSQTFQHTIDSKKFSAWIREAGYEYSFIGENLAIDFVSSEGAIKAWLNSPTHRKNILNKKFSENGIAIVEGQFQGENTTLVVQIFGTPLLAATNSENNPGILKLKNSDNKLSEFKIENENLLTNIQDNPTMASLPSSDIGIYNPENYLTVFKINPASADWQETTNTFNYTNLILYLVFITSISIVANLFFYKPQLKEEKIQQ